MNVKSTGCVLLTAASMALTGVAMGQAGTGPWKLVATGDFGANSSDGTPDGCTALLWWNRRTGSVMIHYMNDDGVTVKNIIGSIDQINVLTGGSGYYSSDVLEIDDSGTGGLSLIHI